MFDNLFERMLRHP